MSGHSRWSNIKHKKAAADKKRGKTWSKLSRAITMAARGGGGNILDNPRLRLVVDKAKDANMPKDTIDKAIKKGTGELEGENYEEIVYEGYGAGGVAILCQILTDNRHRTAPEIKKIFERCGGNLGTTNSVAWMFAQKGVLLVDARGVEEDRVMEVALEAGAEDVQTSGAVYEIQCPAEAFRDVRTALEETGFTLQSAEVTMVASSSIRLENREQARKVLRLMEELDNHDDVESVSSNFDMPDDIMEEMSAEM